MLRGNLIVVIPGIPPLLNILERIPVASAIDQHAAFSHPGCNMLMSLGRQGLHAGVRHDENFRVLPGIRIGYIFQVQGLDRNTPLQKRQYLAVKIGKLRVFVSGMGRKLLKHQ